MTYQAILFRLSPLVNDIYSGAFSDQPEPKQLVMTAVTLAFFWFGAFAVITGALARLIRDEPEWIRRASDRDYKRNGKEMAKLLGHDSSPETCRKNFIRLWPYTQALSIQHFVGGFLCIPSLFHLLPNNPSLASSLACLGILSELGWEIQDLATWIYRRYCTKGGKDTVALPFLPKKWILETRKAGRIRRERGT